MIYSRKQSSCISHRRMELVMFHYFPNRQSSSKGRIAASFAALGIAYYMLSEEAPFTKRRRLILTSPIMEQYMAEQSYSSIISQTRNALLSKNSPYHQKISEIAKKLISSNQSILPTDVDWDVHVIDSSDMNAFVLPNGKIFFFKGLFNLIQNDSECAAVLAHELSHVVARHSAESTSFMSLLTLISLVLGFHVSGVESILATSNSRKMEHEADEISLHLMANACYDPYSAVELWRKFELLDKNRNIEFLSTHPTHKNRAERIKSKIPDVGDWKKNCKFKWWY
eukprot:NODE_202_length_14999_cov_0.270067.p8 type:complete len:283 gc:universal NODE_202_length_14999_cov_0.270067:7523-8371(+)